MKEQLAFIDHEYHFKTRSGDFLRKIFKKKYKIVNFWIKKDLKIPKRALKYNNFFFFQIFPRFEFLNQTFGKNIMWAPMYDSPMYPTGYNNLLWQIVSYYGIKVLSFSKKISLDANKNNIKLLDIQYFKKTSFSKNKKKKIDIFFWYRGDIKLSDWKNIVDFSKVNKIIYFRTSDTKEEKLNISEEKKIKFITKPFLKNKEFLKMINITDVFICPRKKEGIGMAQVEALAQGKFLIGFNDATMDEYIINKKIGVLFNNATNIKINHSNISKFYNYRIKYNSTGYENFQKNKIKIINFFNSERKITKNIVKKISITTQYYIFLIYRKFLKLIFK